MKYIFETYLNIISEEQNPFDKNKHVRIDTYKDISIYVSKAHVLLRNNERYNGKVVIKTYILKFLKEIVKENILSSLTYNKKKFMVFFTISNIKIAGELQKISGKWYCKIDTLLPPQAAVKHYDLYREITL